MKKIIFLASMFLSLSAVVFAYDYNISLPLPGKSIADIKLQQNTLFTAYMFGHRIAVPECEKFDIIDTQVSKAKVGNKWQEVWTLKACSKTALIPINFELKPEGATYAIDPMGVKVISK